MVVRLETISRRIDLAPNVPEQRAILEFWRN